MPRKSDTTDDEAKEGSRVTRSLRKRLNSVDQEETTPPKSKSADSKLGPINEQRSSDDAADQPDDTISVDDSCSMSSSQQPAGSVRRTRARLNSSLTVENVTALTTGSPARRNTRRSSGAVEPAPITGTPARRTTRRSSQTSDDGSVVSSQMQSAAGRSTRRSIARPTTVETLDEEDEPPTESKSVLAATKTPRRTDGTPDRRFKASVTLSDAAKNSDMVVVLESDEEEVAVKEVPSSSVPHPVGIHRSTGSPLIILEEIEATQKCSVKLTPLKPENSSPVKQNTPVVAACDSSVVAVDNTSAAAAANTSAVAAAAHNRSASPNIFSGEEVEIKQSPKSVASSPSPVASAASPIAQANSPLRKIGSPAVALRSSPRLSVAGTASPVQSVAAPPPQTPKRSTRLSLNGSQQSPATKEVENKSPAAVASAEPNDSMEPMEVDTSVVATDEANTSVVSAVDEKKANTSVAAAVNEKANASVASSNGDDDDDDAAMQSANTSASGVDGPQTAHAAITTVTDGNKSLGGARRSSMATPDANLLASNKSVTFAEPPADPEPTTPTAAPQQMNASAEDEFHDTCSDLPEADVSAENGGGDAASATETAVRSPFVLDAGVTPLRKRPNLSLRSSTPIVTSTATPTAPLSQPAAAVVEPVVPSQLVDKRKTIGSTRETTATASPELRRPPLSRSWSQAVHGSAGSAIDRGTSKPRVDNPIVDEEIVIKVPVRKPQLDDYDDDDEEDDDPDRTASSNSFVDGEAEEAPEGAESGDSMDSSERREIEENEIPEAGVSIGSEDSDEDAAGGEEQEDEEDEMDSFIVSDGDVDEDDLLDGTGDDLADVSNERSPAKKGAKKRKSVKRIDSSSSSAASVAGEDELAHDESLCVEEEDEVVQEEGGAVQSSGMDSSTSAKDESTAEDEQHAAKNMSVVQVTDRQTSKLLSKSLHQPKEKQRNGKHNKSVNAAQLAVDGDEKVKLSPFELRQQKRKSLKANGADAVEAETPVVVADDTKQVRKSLNKSLAATEVEEEKVEQQESAEEPADVEMTEAPAQQPKPKSKAPIQFKAPQYESILDRCGQILAKANEARRQEKLQNKKEITEEQVDLLKQKKEARQLEKARRAAALIEQEKQEAERRKRKAEKKAARKLAAEQEALKPKPVAAVVAEPTEKTTAHKSKKTNEKHIIPASTIDAQPIVGKPKKAEYFPLPDVADVLAASKKKPKIAGKVVVEEQQPEVVAVAPAVMKTKKQKHKEAAEVVVEDPVVKSKKLKKQVPNAVVKEAPIIVEPVPVVHVKKSKKQQHVEPEPEPAAKKPKKHQQPAATIDRNSSTDDSPKKQQHSEQPAKKQKKLLKIVKMNSEPQQPAVEPSTSSTITAAATQKPQAVGKKKRTVNDAAFDAAELPAPVSKKFKTTKADAAKVKKRLNILNSSSSSDGVATTTAAPASSTTSGDNYKILQIRSQPTAVNNSSNKTKKRKAVIHEKPTIPDKPQWTSAGAFVVSKVAAAAQAGNENYTTSTATSDFVVTSLSKKRKLLHNAAGGSHSSTDAVAAAAADLAAFRERAQFDKRVKRETAKQLLQRKDKQRANSRV